MSLSDIVNVSISRETSAVSQVGFGIINIIGKNLNSSNRIEYFSTDSLPAIAAALAGGTSAPEYIAASAAASAKPKPVKVAISQVIAPKILTDDEGTLLTDDIVKVTVNGTEVSETYDTSKDTTLTNLATAIQGLTPVATATYDNGAHTITITPAADTVLKVEFDLSGVTSGTMAAFTLSTGANSEEYDTALGKVLLLDNDWYGLICTSRVQADVEKVMTWVEANEKMFVTASSEANIKDQTEAADTTTIAYTNKSNAYARTYVLYKGDAATKFGDAGWLGGLLPRTPGSYTGMFKKAFGSAVDALNPTEAKNILDKNANTYQTINGVNIVRESKSGDGEYFDVIHFIDWLTARISENVFGLFARSDKTPFTPEGLFAIRGEIDKVLSAGVSAGGISNEAYNEDGDQIGGYSITMPDYSTILSNDKAERTLNNIKFAAWLAGAIHAGKIFGTVTL